MRIRSTLLALVTSLCLGPLFAAEQVYKAPDPEPTVDETLILELMNRFRADPVGEVERLLKPGESNPWRGVDWAMFTKEMKALQPAPPLVFNLKLLDAARKHSHYMVLNGLTHIEEPSKAGFTGASPGDRAKLAGYQSNGWGENAFRDPGSAAHSHLGFLVDAGDGPGGMQPTRGHRTNMISKGYREVGPSAVPHGDHGNVSVTHLFGAGTAPRFCGGVVYLDKNENHFYDPGEGIGNVKITGNDGSTVSTWKSGAFTLPLKNAGPVTFMAEYGGEKVTKTFPAGKDNIKFDFEISPSVHFKRCDVLIAAVEAAGKDEAKLFVAKVNLLEDSRDLYLDADRKAKVKELTGSLPDEINTHKQAVMIALKEYKDPAAFSAVLTEHRAPFKGTRLEAWFTQAESAVKAAQMIATFDQKVATAKLSGIKAPDVASTRASIDDLKKIITASDLQAVLDELKNKIG